MDRYERLMDVLRGYGSVLVAYSGGLDSAFLLKAAVDGLGRGNVLAVTARSETYPLSEYREAIRVAKSIGARHKTIMTSGLGIKGFRENPKDRCYYCKKELFSKLVRMAGEYGLGAVLDGTNSGDLKDVRYGRKAARELGVKSPLLECGMGKDDIRKYSKRLKLPTWDKPSFACLASRIPFNSRITAGKLGMVERAEEYIRGLGFRQVRVRHHGDTARLEFPGSDIRKAASFGVRASISARLRSIGFKYISLDLDGYRTGSMHDAIDKKGGGV